MSRLADRVVVAFTHFALKRPMLLVAACAIACFAIAGQDAPAPGSPLTPAAILPDHKVLPNDLLAVTVVGEPDLSRNTRVGADGKIELPQLTDKVQAAGMMPREIETEIAKALVDGQLLLHPVVTVALLEYAERSISVVGDVRTPGRFTITTPVSLYEALARAGWVTPDAAADVLLTTPDSPTPRKISLRDLQMGTDPTLNAMLTGGETINVPDAKKELAARFPAGPKVWVVGSVAHVSVYTIANPADATVTKAVASAGGATLSNVKWAWIYRNDGNGNQRPIPIPFDEILHHKAEDVTLEADDVLLVPESDTKKMQEYYKTHPLRAPWEMTK